MPRKAKDHYDDDFESDDAYETETLISRNKPPRAKSAPSKKSKKSVYRPGSPNKGKARTGKDLWMNAIKKRQTGALNGRDSPRHKTPIEYWVDTLRKTGTGISTESGGLNSMSGLKKTNDMSWAYLSTSHYMRQVMGTEKKKNVDDPTAKSAAGTPSYKSQEEYYEQILELKKTISQLSQDNSTMKARVRRLEEDNIKKEKEIDGLLHPEKNEELRRTMGDRKPDTGAVIHSLKQKILKLEMQLRDKEASYVKLASELKTTKVDEMKLQMEVLYQEVLRLQNSRDTGVDKSRSTKEGGPKVKALNETIIRLSKANEQLKAENKGLKEDLDKALDEPEGEVESSRREYDDMNKKQLLSVIAKAERRAERAERKLEADNLSMASMDSRRSGVKDKIVLKGTLEERLNQLDERESELLDEIEKLKVKVKRLTNERNRKKNEYDSHHTTPRSPPAPIPRHRRPSTQDSGREAKVQNFTQKHAATSIQRQWRDRKARKQEEEEMEKMNNFRKNHAAKAIQSRWRRHHDAENEEAAFVIQSALRGHHRRRAEIRRHRDEIDDDYESYSTGSDEAVYMIQSSLKGHKGRRDRMRKMRLDSAGEEDDDADLHQVYAGRRMSGARRPSSAHSRSSFSRKTTVATYPVSRNPSYDDDDDIEF